MKHTVSGKNPLAKWAQGERPRLMLLLLPNSIILIGALLVPLGVLLAYSFWTQTYLDVDKTWTLSNYADIVSKPLYYSLYKRTIGIATTVTIITILMAYPMAYFVAFDVKKNKMIWLILITLPFWTSYLLRIFAWKIILGYNGVVNSGLSYISVIEEPLQFLLYNSTAVTITLTHAWAAFAFLPIYVSLEKIDPTYLEAAADLGDGPIRQFLRVTLPMSSPGIIAASVLIFIPTFGDYVTPQLVGGTSGSMIGNYIQVQFGSGNNWPLGSAISLFTMVLATLAACLFILLTRLTFRGSK